MKNRSLSLMVVVDITVRQKSLGRCRAHAFETGCLLDKLNQLDRLFAFAGPIQAIGRVKTDLEDGLSGSLLSE